MIDLDENALMCDLAETYHIFNYRSLPCSKVATFSCGLEDDSRIKRKISGINVDQQTLLLATIADGVNLLAWLQTEDGAKGRNRPISIVDKLLNANEPSEEVTTFDSGEEFKKEWDKRTKGE